MALSRLPGSPAAGSALVPESWRCCQKRSSIPPPCSVLSWWAFHFEDHKKNAKNKGIIEVEHGDLMRYRRMRYDEIRWDVMWWDMMRYDEMCWDMMRFDEIRWDVMRCDEIWWDMMRYDEMWWDVMRYDEIWWDMMRYDEIWWDVKRCDEMWWDMTRYDEIWWDVMRYHEIWYGNLTNIINQLQDLLEKSWMLTTKWHFKLRSCLWQNVLETNRGWSAYRHTMRCPSQGLVVIASHIHW